MNELWLSPTTLPNASPLEYIEAAEFASCDGIGLRLNQSPGLPCFPIVGDLSLIRKIQETIKRSSMKVHDIYSFYLVPETVVSDFSRALELGAELGAQYAVVMGNDSNWSRMSDNFVKLCDLAKQFNITCTIEAGVMRSLASLSQVLKLINESNRDNAVVCFDPLNFHRAGGQASDILDLDPKLFPYGQITDGIVSPDDDLKNLGKMSANIRRFIGEGVVPLISLLDALPNGIPLSIEMPMPLNLDYSSNEWTKIAVNNCRNFLNSYHKK